MKKEITERIYDVLDQPKKEEFLTQTFENLKLLNYYFKIESDWARGSREILMVTVLLWHQLSPEIEENISKLCKKFSKKMQSNKDIFTGFYINDLDQYDELDRESIIKSEILIKDWLKDLYWETLEGTRKKSEEEKITLLLNDRYIFESLEKMSEELKNISREINSSNLKANVNINNSISNLNKIIDDIYGGYIEKMTELDIENEDNLFFTEEELDRDIQKSKKELMLALEEEFREKEKKGKSN
ncbi:MAG: hypothetical protein ACFE9Q_17040 [Candidatus Hodarchaeota archaeon]